MHNIRHTTPLIRAAALLSLLLTALPLSAGTSRYVSPSGNNANAGTIDSPWRTIQYACDHGAAGMTVFIMPGTFNEKISVNTSGSAAEGFFTLKPFDTGTVIIDGAGIAGDQIILVSDRSWVRVEGLELRNNLQQSFGTGIWVQGYGDHIELADNLIHDMRAAPGGDAMGISVYGSSAAPLSNIVVTGNTVRDCEPGHSEALTFNGNVDTFLIADNVVHDVNNIGIDMIGGEKTSPDPAQDIVRNGICRGNTVYNARSSYGGGYAAGIYVDGGQHILIERNIVHDADVGMEIGCENKGITASNMTVRSNLLYHNDKRGLSFGGYNYPATGRVANSVFTNNTLFDNDRLGTGEGELYVENATNCAVANNIVFSRHNRLITTTVGNTSGNVFDHNRYFTTAASGNAVDFNGDIFAAIGDYMSAAGQDSHSSTGNPQFTDTSALNFRLTADSPCINTGNNAYAAVGDTDLAGSPRIIGPAVDLGAYEFAPTLVPLPVPLLKSVSGTFPHYTFTWLLPYVTPVDSSQFVLSNDSTFASALVSVTTGEMQCAIDTLPGPGKYYWRVRALKQTEWSAWSARLSFIADTGGAQIDLHSGWNLLSVPVTGPSPAVTLFPTATSAAYSYSHTYQAADTLRAGPGYWMKFAGAQPAVLHGVPVDSLSIPVTDGWNLIGSTGHPMQTSSVTADGTTILSQFFEFNNGYHPIDILQPGKGYWVKVSADGVLTFH